MCTVYCNQRSYKMYLRCNLYYSKHIISYTHRINITRFVSRGYNCILINAILVLDKRMLKTVLDFKHKCNIVIAFLAGGIPLMYFNTLALGIKFAIGLILTVPITSAFEELP